MAESRELNAERCIRRALQLAPLAPFALLLATAATPTAQSAGSQSATFTKDITPILQRSCQHCHNPEGVAPMSLVTYEEVRPWARAMKMRTGLGPRAGVMPPWFVERTSASSATRVTRR